MAIQYKIDILAELKKAGPNFAIIECGPHLFVYEWEEEGTDNTDQREK